MAEEDKEGAGRWGAVAKTGRGVTAGRGVHGRAQLVATAANEVAGMKIQGGLRESYPC